MSMARCTDTEFMSGQITHYIKVTGQIIILTERVIILGTMVVGIKGVGKTTLLMGMVRLYTKMVGPTKDILKWIRKMAMECINGVKVKYMMVSGKMESIMDRVATPTVMVNTVLVHGKTEKLLNMIMRIIKTTKETQRKNK